MLGGPSLLDGFNSWFNWGVDIQLLVFGDFYIAGSWTDSWAVTTHIMYFFCCKFTILTCSCITCTRSYIVLTVGIVNGCLGG